MMLIMMIIKNTVQKYSKMFAIITDLNQGHLIQVNFLQTAGSFH